MSELFLTNFDDSNMHVKEKGVHVNSDLVAELTEAALNEQKAGTRGIIAARLGLLWQQCEPFIRDSLGDGLDVRMAKLGLDVLDRMIKIHEVLEPDRPTVKADVDVAITLQRRQEVLDALSARSVGSDSSAELLGGDEVTQ